MNKIEKINIARDFNLDAYNVEDIYEKLISTNEGNSENSDLLIRVIERSSKAIEPRFDLDFYSNEDYQWALFDQLEALYPKTFGVELSEACDNEKEFTFIDLVNACYNYIVNNIVTEIEFLEDFKERVTKRNKKIAEKLEEDKESLNDLIK